MQFLTAKSLLYIRVVTLLVVSYYMLKDPEGLSTAGFVLLMGQAVQVPILRLAPSNPLLSIVSIFFATTALSDLIPLLAENWNHFETLVPVRLFAYFLIVAFTYFVPESAISNSLVVTYSMFEIWCNFLIYNNLRDEKFYRMKKFVEENADAIKQAQDEKITVIE
ncbi:hypothetical protein PVL30_001539 [Lodderomyces elongisporus]|uniref:Protein ILM1 n=1 Tax=Lodderomyces elongisporus (strain ATCC 11503 / CBS 2605 / JCM 1781 / NBRC 1676 / NRRL YB-4239) TaxID=379508 RepID=A5DW33_LODEL|nr:uncharacterized protein PVL30_001539 [Lodderomyces elongisporus]EDK43391.1 conserved hypothetical protein [Lodderomyces elongisporus NRRL YB-4239]WLF77819.1 hypothetical protein PVL30_001539 [Lodderomyces elongisporus]